MTPILRPGIVMDRAHAREVIRRLFILPTRTKFMRQVAPNRMPRLFRLMATPRSPTLDTPKRAHWQQVVERSALKVEEKGAHSRHLRLQFDR